MTAVRVVANAAWAAGVSRRAGSAVAAGPAGFVFFSFVFMDMTLRSRSRARYGPGPTGGWAQPHSCGELG
ncbi:hypothetical protein GCM10010302_40770 [Streptomyces polychromogenes]|uniref:Uncharacterized protein n=1 Tax=Streptomyces polychromogenes TaxID=67342 RepID=A0ABP3F390_9ACTN